VILPCTVTTTLLDHEAAPPDAVREEGWAWLTATHLVRANSSAPAKQPCTACHPRRGTRASVIPAHNLETDFGTRTERENDNTAGNLNT
jgi:cytochrome c